MSCNCASTEWHIPKERARSLGRRRALVPPHIRWVRHTCAHLLPARMRHRHSSSGRVGRTYIAAMAHGRPLHRKLSQLCPSMQPGSLLDRVRNVVGLGSGTLLTDNANISVLPLGDGQVLCLTEATKSSVLIDPETLDTIGKL